MIEPIQLSNNLLVPRTVVKKAGTIVIPVTNLSDSFKTLKKDTFVGSIVDFEEALEYDVDNQGLDFRVPVINKIEQTLVEDVPNTVDEMKKILPAHVQDLFMNSVKDLSIAETKGVAKLLHGFQDIFATNDMDSGKFTAIKHKINTDDAKPIRQPMRRTAQGFEREEHKHLDQMLKMGVVRESNSGMGLSTRFGS